jgi:predicted amidophosphoribosyltransferase
MAIDIFLVVFINSTRKLNILLILFNHSCKKDQRLCAFCHENKEYIETSCQACKNKLQNINI